MTGDKGRDSSDGVAGGDLAVCLEIIFAASSHQITNNR